LHNARLLKSARAILPRSLRSKLDPLHARIEETLRSFSAQLSPSARVLDAGAGECPFRAFFANNYYVSVDKAVGDAEWDYSRLSAVADLEALPFATGSFDAAVCTVVLEHVPNPHRVLVELRRVLQASGRIYIAVPQFWELHQAPNDFFRYTRYGLEHLLCSSGFKILELEATGGYFHLMGKLSIDLLQFFQKGLRVVFFPLLAPLFGVVIPLVCFYLDKFDREKAFSVGLIAVAEAAPESVPNSGRQFRGSSIQDWPSNACVLRTPYQAAEKLS
jgi:SAM-dependent methyltransferase